MGARVENLQSMTEPYSGTVKLSNGREIEADLIFPVIGSKAASGLLDNLPDIKKSNANRVVVDGWMRPSSLPNVFAAGDIADMGDAMTVVASGRQKEWLAKTLTALSEGKQFDAIKTYKPWKKAPILVPLGPDKGNSFLIFCTAGDFITRKMKGEDLFLTKYNKIFGRTT